ncbi:probable G-protein coupled receptor 141 [Stegostoma tigrinum]|uniref:probable G-protein coupled receptor 141 n=1 Tax=Stegostoma tigrinum TaxID=3053191 RepID=UPI00202B9245|nr:probable G-protein coupled receptor 141 [Stegostoma tigrinum]XP_059502300.1 probable G-protein coupled receptor 141 [Stegostoma tigrinum]
MNNTTSLTGTFTSNNFTSNGSFHCSPSGSTYNAALIAIYTIVLVGGSTGALIMTWKIKTDSKSVTSTAVVNLILMHTFFLLTVPFRISYYVLNEWKFGEIFCKLVSAMIHAHMYLCFMFYVAIIVIRMISFFREKKTVDFYQPWHAVAVSLVVWVLVFLAVFPLFLTYFDSSQKDGKCFQFTVTTTSSYVKVVNCLAVITVLTTFGVLLAIQMGIIAQLMIRYQNNLLNQQEFGAQTKTLLFILIMICFVPYLAFRPFYISQLQCSLILSITNEILLAVTSISCFDVLAFLVASR